VSGNGGTTTVAGTGTTGAALADGLLGFGIGLGMSPDGGGGGTGGAPCGTVAQPEPQPVSQVWQVSQQSLPRLLRKWLRSRSRIFGRRESQQVSQVSQVLHGAGAGGAQQVVGAGAQHVGAGAQQSSALQRRWPSRALIRSSSPARSQQVSPQL
jgi:hypothetical protein